MNSWACEMEFRITSHSLWNWSRMDIYRFWICWYVENQMDLCRDKLIESPLIQIILSHHHPAQKSAVLSPGGGGGGG